MSKKVVIVGAGMAGLCTAYYCAREGFDVTVVDRGEPVRDGASYGNAGMIVPSHFIPLAAPGMVALGLKWMWNPASPFYIKPRFDTELFGWAFKFWKASTAAHVRRTAPLIAELSLASRTCFEELNALPGMDCDFEKRGLVMLCREQHTLEEEGKTAEQARALGVPAEVFDAAATAKLNPGARMNVAGSIYFPLDCHLSPRRFLVSLQGELVRRGVAFRWTTEAKAFRKEGGKVRAVQVEGGQEILADEFVLCGGTWAPDLVADLGLRLPMQAGKGYSLTLEKPHHQLTTPSILTEARVAVTPMGDTLRVGGTMEVAGRDLGINPVRVRGIVDSFCRYFPDYEPKDFAEVKPWAGLRPCSPDGMPYIGRTQKFSNLCVAAGHAMMGLSLGPITGKLIADTLSGRPIAAAKAAVLSPDRY
jgi:D-amino-acid dehydrogenase